MTVNGGNLCSSFLCEDFREDLCRAARQNRNSSNFFEEIRRRFLILCWL